MCCPTGGVSFVSPSLHAKNVFPVSGGFLVKETTENLEPTVWCMVEGEALGVKGRRVRASPAIIGKQK